MSPSDPRERSVPLRPVSEQLASPPSGSWINAYLALLRSRTANLDLRLLGLSGLGGTVELERVYVPLFGITGLDASSPREVRTTLDMIVEKSAALLLIGDSGCGKSAFLRHRANQYLAAGTPVPLFVELGDLNDGAATVRGASGRLPATTLVKCFVRNLVDDGVAVTEAQVQAFVEATPVVWLLDGLNEINDPETRSQMGGALAASRVLWPSARFVVTATDAVVRDGTAPPSGNGGFEQVLIDRFRREDVPTFLDRFLETLQPGVSAEQRRAKWEPIAGALLRSPELEELLASPLNLTAIAIILLFEPQDPMAREVPSVRVDLLERVVSWVFRRRNSTIPARLRGNHGMNILAALGYAMVAASPGPLKKVGIAGAARELAALGSFEGDGVAAEEAITALVDAGIVLNRTSVGDVTMQDTFRDYFASRHLVRGARPRPEWKDVLAQYVDDPSRRLVMRLVPGQLLRGGTSDVDEFFRWLSSSSYSQDLETRLKRVALGGSILRELKAAGYSSLQIPEWRSLVSSVGEVFRRPLPWIPLRTRYEAAVAFGLEGDIRVDDFDSAWATIPGADALCGAQCAESARENYDPLAAPWEGPVHRVQLHEVSVRVFPVTVSEFARFVDAGGYTNERGAWDGPALSWRERAQIVAPLDWHAQLLLPNTPVTGLSWFEARAYCAWLIKTRADGYVYRLPLEDEWEVAARRGLHDRHVFPWGESLSWGDAAEANWAGALLRRKSPVGMFPRSTTLDGIADMFGNVEEWCEDRWSDLRGQERAEREDLGGEVDPKALRVVRGGSCIRFSRLMRPSYRSRVFASGRYHTVGLRLVRDSHAGRG